MSVPIIQIKNISYNRIDDFGFKKNIIDNVSFNIDSGKITSFLYREKGKQEILLKIFAGLVNPDSGEITSDKKIIYIPSESSSLPWLNVKENIFYNLSNTNDEKYLEIIKLVGLKGYEEHRPHNKSIGFRFRIALARSLINDGDVIVLENPFHKMDYLTKKECTLLIREVNQSGISIIFSTADLLDTIDLADDIFVMTSIDHIEKINNENNHEKIILKIKNILE